VDTVDLIADERRSPADTRAGATDGQWLRPSRCDGWRARDVLAHLVFPFEVSIPSLLVRMARARLDVNRMSDTAARDDRRAPEEPLAICGRTAGGRPRRRRTRHVPGATVSIAHPVPGGRQ
jgi:hypothetical protein